MALTNQQVQQVFLAITGRPAEGSAVAWGANSLSVAALANSVVDIRKGADFTNSKEAFVENLYSQLLGRPSDTEGKEFWLNALNNGASYGDVLSQFINAILAQPSSADLYTLQNKLGIAEQISAQVTTLQGGAAAEATLKDMMSNVDANTTIDSLSNDLEDFKGQYVNVATVSANTKADNETPTEGSEENASVFNATVSILDNTISSDESSLLLTGSTNYADTLNLTLKSSKEATEKQETIDLAGVLTNVKDVNTLNLNVKDTKIAGTTYTNDTYKTIKFDGTSTDNITVSKSMDLLDTGAGDDIISVGAAATVKAGAGTDNITITATDVTISVDGGAGKDTVTFTGTSSNNTDDFTKVTLSNVEVLAGAGTVKSSLLSGKTYTLSDNTDLVATKATSGIDLSKLKLADDATTAKLTVQDVKSGTVTLVKSDKPASVNPTTDTVKLDAAASKVTIKNIASGDSLDLTETGLVKLTASEKAVKVGGGASAGSAYTITDVKVNFVDAGKNITTVNAAFDYLVNGDSTGVTVVASSSSAGAVLVAFNNGKGSSTLYSIVNEGSGTKLTKDMMTLLGTVDNNIDTSDAISTTPGVLTFA